MVPSPFRSSASQPLRQFAFVQLICCKGPPGSTRNCTPLFRLVKWYPSSKASSTMGEPAGRQTVGCPLQLLLQHCGELVQVTPCDLQGGGGGTQSPLVHTSPPVQPAFVPGSQLAQQPLLQ